MANTSTQRKKWIYVVQILALICLTFAPAGVAVAGNCTSKTYEVDVPDTATLKLKDGEHTIAAIETFHGKLEARVMVKRGVVSDPILFLDGKPLKEISKSEIPKALLDCLPKAELPSEGLLSKASRSILDWVVPPADAKGRKCVWKVTATCLENKDGSFVCHFHSCWCGRCQDSIESVKS